MDRGGYEAYMAWSIPNLAAEQVRTGAWQEQDALERSKAAVERFLPQGFQTPGHFFLDLVEVDKRVGMLWLFVDPVAGHKTAYLYHVLIEEAHRGRGLGSQAMKLAEGEARDRGCTALELTVFPWNQAARRLYAKLGYTELNIRMGKRLL